jgi:hypothetical protein
LSGSSIFQFRGQQLEQVLVDIVLSPNILICLAEQLWVGQAIDACLYTATNEAIAPCSQLINLLRSRNFTLSSLLLSSHFASELRATVLDLFKFQRPSKIFRGTFPAKTSICEALRVFFSNFGQQLACQNFTHTFYRRLCAAREQVSTELSRSKSDWCHVVTFPARECSTESIGWQPLSWMFHFLLFDQVLEGDRILSDPVFLNKVASIFTAALSFVRSN